MDSLLMYVQIVVSAVPGQRFGVSETNATATPVTTALKPCDAE